MTTTPSLLIRCWGCRGSIPSPGPHTGGYGGNTSCLEVRVDGRRLVFDAGSGFRLLGNQVDVDEEGSVRLFFTHFHWDHVQGLPFFAPLFDPALRLDVHAPRQAVGLESVFAGQMGPIYFPVPFSAVACDLRLNELTGEDWEEDGVRVTSFRVRHPGNTVGYRIEAAGRVVCYIPDNEMRGEMYGLGAEWRDDLVAFVEGADVLFHDSMYTDEEYTARVGWGHSTFRDSLDLACDAGVGSLFFFHHDPERRDAELNEILKRYRDEADRRGLPVEVNAAFQGKQIVY